MIVYQFNCFFEDSFVGMTSRQFGKRVKKHVPKSREEFYKMSDKENKTVRTVNASKRSAIAENLINNSNCASNYNLNRFKIIKNCFCISDLIKLEAICILIRKLKLCKQKDFDYTVSLFS